MNNKLINIANSLLILICLISVWGGLVYRFYSLNRPGILISLILAIISFIIIQYFHLLANKKINYQSPDEPDSYHFKLKLINFILYILYFIPLLLCFYILFSHRNALPLTSPWTATPAYFFIFYALATALLIGNCLINKKLALPLIMLHYFLSFSVALIIYELGYGYDSFIHQATENLIAETGAVEPKPFYYLGQYALTVIIHKITLLPIVWLDKLILPLLAALFLPLTLFRILKSWFDSISLNLILITALLALSFPFLIVTTPQNLAYFFLILAILSGLNCKNPYDFSVILLLASAAAITHPVAGMPALLLSAFLAVYHSDRVNIKKYIYPLLIITAIFSLPVLFYFLNQRLAASAPNNNLTLNINELALNMPNQENFILNFVYLYGFNLKFILGLLAINGIFVAVKHRGQCRILWLYLGLSAALFISYFITAKLPFAFLIDYERDNYPQRILLAAGLFLLPFFMLSLYSLIKKIAKQNIFIISSFAALLILLTGAALYITYPRHDNYFNSHGYAVSGDDMAAVDWINRDAQKDFIVLANQQVSAAALSRFGFKKYYYPDREQIFYYPIPTSSPLYKYYLDMVYKKPDRETMLAAMDSVKVDKGYFVLNKYWRAFAKIADEAKLSASSWQEINNGEVIVFKYER